MAQFDEWQFANNVFSALAAGIDAVQTTITVAPGTGALFPTTYPYHITLENFALEKREICRVTDVTGDVLTVVRGQDGFAAQAFDVSDIVSMRLTAGQLDDFVAGLKRLDQFVLPPAGVEPTTDPYGVAVQNGAFFYNTARAQWGFREDDEWIYVTDRPRLDISDSVPLNPVSPQLWFQPSALQLFIYYDDGDSSQWVPTSPVTTTLSVPQTMVFDMFEDTETVVAKTLTRRIQGRRTFSDIRMNVAAQSTTTAPEVNFTLNGTTIFTTNLTIDVGARTSETATIPYSLNTTQLTFQDDDEVAVTVVNGGDATGLTVYLITRVA